MRRCGRRFWSGCGGRRRGNSRSATMAVDVPGRHTTRGPQSAVRLLRLRHVGPRSRLQRRDDQRAYSPPQSCGPSHCGTVSPFGRIVSWSPQALSSCCCVSPLVLLRLAPLNQASSRQARSSFALASTARQKFAWVKSPPVRSASMSRAFDRQRPRILTWSWTREARSTTHEMWFLRTRYKWPWQVHRIQGRSS
jgi:hypothetical protein